MQVCNRPNAGVSPLSAIAAHATYQTAAVPREANEAPQTYAAGESTDSESVSRRGLRVQGVGTADDFQDLLRDRRLTCTVHRESQGVDQLAG